MFARISLFDIASPPIQPQSRAYKSCVINTRTVFTPIAVEVEPGLIELTIIVATTVAMYFGISGLQKKEVSFGFRVASKTPQGYFPASLA